MMVLEKDLILNFNRSCEYFHSKLLLFGEYAIVKGGQGLAIPFPKFKGCLKIGDLKTDKKFFELFDYLKKSPLLAKRLDLERFRNDLELGLCFDSNIPQGYGIGSSGALCAAIYSEYIIGGQPPIESSKDLKELQDYMALMESFYHGTSSGLDCLISLIDKPVHIKDRKDVVAIEAPRFLELGNFYLFDSDQQRKTSPLVHQFLTRFEKENSFQISFKKFMKLNDLLIQDLLNHDTEALKDHFKNLSELQGDLLSDMIPPKASEFWQKGLTSGEYYTKFCGAGGGGFFLVYSPHKLNETGLIAL